MLVNRHKKYSETLSVGIKIVVESGPWIPELWRNICCYVNDLGFAIQSLDFLLSVGSFKLNSIYNDALFHLNEVIVTIIVATLTIQVYK
jgi:hypothetical protein